MTAKLIALLLFFSPLILGAQTNPFNNQFKEANTFYEQGNYQKAIEHYLELEQEGIKSESLYFNLGNSYYKQQQVAPSIYYYEKALLLNPNHQAAQLNLKFVQKMRLDEIQKVEIVARKDLIHNLFKGFNYNQWAWLFIGFSFLIFAAFASYFLAVSSNAKRLFFSFSMVFILGAVTSLYAAYSEKNYAATFLPAILFDKNIDLKEEPKKGAKTLRTLHEGTKVFILEEKALWYKVRLENQEVGWLLQEQLRTLQ